MLRVSRDELVRTVPVVLPSAMGSSICNPRYGCNMGRDCWRLECADFSSRSDVSRRIIAATLRERGPGLAPREKPVRSVLPFLAQFLEAVDRRQHGGVKIGDDVVRHADRDVP